MERVIRDGDVISAGGTGQKSHRPMLSADVSVSMIAYPGKIAREIANDARQVRSRATAACRRKCSRGAATTWTPVRSTSSSRSPGPPVSITATSRYDDKQRPAPSRPSGNLFNLKSSIMA